MDLNEATLLGRLTRDPAIRQTATGKKVASFALATSRKWKDANGETKEVSAFHNIVLWGAQAGIAEKYLRKGSQIWIRGEISYRTYQGKDGADRSITEIIGRDLILLAQPKGAQSGQGQQTNRQPVQSEPLYTRKENVKTAQTAADPYADEFPLDFSELNGGGDVEIPF